MNLKEMHQQCSPILHHHLIRIQYIEMKAFITTTFQK